MIRVNSLTQNNSIKSTARTARRAVIEAHAVGLGDFDSSLYEDHYGDQAECIPSFLPGQCLWRCGDWQAHEAIVARA